MQSRYYLHYLQYVSALDCFDVCSACIVNEFFLFPCSVLRHHTKDLQTESIAVHLGLSVISMLLKSSAIESVGLRLEIRALSEDTCCAGSERN